MQTLKVGDVISVTHKLLDTYIRGTIVQVETCYFRIKDDLTGNVHTFHWNDNIEIEIQ